MSLFKSRNGGSLFRFRAISGYVKHLFNKRNNDEESNTKTNVMKAKYEVK